MNEWPLLKRQHHLSSLRAAASVSTFSLGFRGGRRVLNEYEVAVTLPHFRMENMRTRAAQREYIRKESASPTFFKDPDSEKAQTVQNDILWDMVKGTPILNVLTNGEQTEPLILDKDGYVVNGNRRLCAMRFLLRKDPHKFQRYGRVRVVILPEDFDESEVRRLEAELQIYPDTRLEYSWVDLALSKRALQESGSSEEEACALYNEDLKSLRQQVGSLALAEKYLQYKNREERYSELPKAEHSFYRLYEGLQKLSTAQERKLLEQIVFTLLDDPTGVSRIYTLIPDMVKDFQAVTSALADELVLDEKEETSQEFADILGEPIVEGKVDPANLADSIQKLSTEEQQAVRDCVVDTVEQLRSKEKNRKSSEQTYLLIKSARAKLQDAVTSFSSKSRVEGLEGQLAGIDGLTKELRKKINAGSSH